MSDQTITLKPVSIRSDRHDEVQTSVPVRITKRDGRVVDFDPSLIKRAVERCFAAVTQKPGVTPEEITNQVVNVVAAQYPEPTVENIQDVVELVLQANGEYAAAKAYILYRAEHARLRQDRQVPAEVKKAFAEADAYFPTPVQQFQFYDKYSRFNYDLGRRETWLETVERSVDYLRELSEDRLPEEDYARIRKAILNMEAMPSMRLLAMAGDPARRNNVAIYNCSYLPADSIDSFVEALIISMSGCGVGFSVERQYVEQLPRIKRQTGAMRPTMIVPDTSDGWAEALRHGLETWFEGEDVEFDYSQVRPAGAPLKVKGGRASGPEPLRAMLRFARERIIARQGSFMTSLDAHDIMCAVGGAAVSGGVRRTAMISLFDYDDDEMRHCKD
ncbi:MAG: ATP cone domain-containing protein, partial [Spirochaetota bacterium]